MNSHHGRLGISARTPAPSRLPEVQGLDIKAQYHLPRTGGDYFDAAVVGRRLVFLLSDIAGERSDAHTIAAEVQDAFRHKAPDLLGDDEVNEPEAAVDLLHEINRALMAASQGVRCAPTFLGIYDTEIGMLTYVNAGGPKPAFRDSSGTRLLDMGGVPLGLFSHLTHEASLQIFEPGAALALVSKGVIEAKRRHEEFGAERVRRVMEQATISSAGKLCSTILESAHAFREQPSFFGPALHIPGFKDTHHFDDLTAAALVRTQGTSFEMETLEVVETLA